MLLAIDIGNTNVTAGVFDAKRLQASWRLATDPRRLPDEYALQLQGLLLLRNISLGSVDQAVICSVVPPLTGVLREAITMLLGIDALIVSAGVRTGVKILYDSPRDVGADRVVDAAAAYHHYGGPVIVVDFGTATVFDAIDAVGAYLGGAIAPGLQVAAESMFQSTSQLRRVELNTPGTAIGKNTVHSVQSGLILGYVGLVEGLVKRFRKELGNYNAQVVATGGLANLIAQETDVIDVVDVELTLKGLQLIHSLNVDRDDSEKHGEA